jgi:hypothetical protein
LAIKSCQIRRNTGEKCGYGVKKKIEGFGGIERKSGGFWAKRSSESIGLSEFVIRW